MIVTAFAQNVIQLPPKFVIYVAHVFHAILQEWKRNTEMYFSDRYFNDKINYCRVQEKMKINIENSCSARWISHIQ